MASSPRLRLWLKWSAITLAALTVLAAIPVLYIETQCKVAARDTRGATYRSILPATDHRSEVNTYLTYPEWSIVHAYEDLAAVTRRGSESDYDYFGAIGRYWSSLCSINRLASSRGTISGEYKVMLHVIGLSFAAEMAVKGAYEKTIGRMTTWLRGTPTPEDEFAQRVADDYATFLRQTPWYEYPFATTLKRFWTETPVFRGSVIRKLERRIALSLEWGVKIVYAKLIGFGAAATPAPLRIKSVVQDLERSDLAADPRIKLMPTLDPSGSIIETDRYRTFTEILQGLAKRGRNITEIAGNRNILVTVLVPPGVDVPKTSAVVLLEVPYGGKVGWRRLALDVKVERLTELIRNISATSAIVEHIYDY